MDIEPSESSRSGSYQIALSDLLFIVVGVGVLMTWWRNAREESFLPTGVVVSLLSGVLWILLLMLAARRGLSSSLSRWVYAIASLMVGAGMFYGGISPILMIAGMCGVLDIKVGVLTTSFAVVMLVIGLRLHRWARLRQKKYL